MPSDLDLLFFDDKGTIDTKESLLEMLKKYKGILSSHTIDYLNSLIGLEFSVLRELISSDDRDVISQLEIYRRIARYNIYNRSINIIKQTDYDVFLYETSTSLSIQARKLNVFSLDYGNNSFFLIPDNYKNMMIGDITLFRIMENLENREAELERIMSRLEYLYGEKNPYRTPANYGSVGTGEYEWDLEHLREISKYEELFKKIDGKQELSDEERIRVEVTTQINDLLLDDYGLTLESFKDDNEHFLGLDDIKKSSKLHKTRVKRMPGITIKNNIEYI